MGAKAVFLSCALFLYTFSPPGLLPSIPGEPQSLYLMAGLMLVGPTLLHSVR